MCYDIISESFINFPTSLEIHRLPERALSKQAAPFLMSDGAVNKVGRREGIMRCMVPFLVPILHRKVIWCRGDEW